MPDPRLAQVNDETERELRPDQIEMFPGKDGKFYWHLVAPNGEILLDGGEGYENDDDLTEMVASLSISRNGVQATAVWYASNPRGE